MTPAFLGAQNRTWHALQATPGSKSNFWDVIFSGSISFQIRGCIFPRLVVFICFHMLLFPFILLVLSRGKGMIVAKYFVIVSMDHSISLPHSLLSRIHKWLYDWKQPEAGNHPPPQPVLTNVTLCDEERAAQLEVPEGRNQGLRDVSKAYMAVPGKDMGLASNDQNGWFLQKYKNLWLWQKWWRLTRINGGDGQNLGWLVVWAVGSPCFSQTAMGFQPCTKSIEISGIASGREAAEALGTRGWGRRGSALTSRRDVNDLMNVRFVLLTFFQIHCWLYILK